VTPSPHGQTVVKPGASQTYDFTIVNSGPAGSTAAYPTFSLSNVGGGFVVNSVSVVTAGTGGVVGACPGNICDFTRIGTITASSVLIRVVVSVFDNGQPISLIGRIVNPVVIPSSGSSNSTGYLSIDETAAEAIGVIMTKTVVSKCYTALAIPTIVSEDVTWLLSVRFFGLVVLIFCFEHLNSRFSRFACLKVIHSGWPHRNHYY